jgi:hypothetical protein
VDNERRIVVLELIVEMLEALDYSCIALALKSPGRVVVASLMFIISQSPRGYPVVIFIHRTMIVRINWNN